MKQKALIYCRVSSTNQKKEGHGLESQEHRCRQYAEQNDYEVEEVFLDDFTGGGDFMRRPAMFKLVEYLDSKPYNQYVIIFDDLKRFARDVQFHWELRTALKKRNATPKCLNYNFDDSPEGEFIETILAAQGELERKQNRRQVIQKQKARLERGYWPFYPPPGYKHIKDPTHGKLLAAEKHKGSIIKEALEGFASGRFQEQIDVLNFLIEKNYTNRPTLETVKRMLTRIIYAGYIEYSEWEVNRRKGYHQPLISLVTYQGIQDKLKDKIKLRTRKDMHADFPLRGFVLCSECREPYTASWSRGRNEKYPYYRCKTKECGAHSKSIRKKKIEADFESILNQIQPTENRLNLVKALFLKRWNLKVQELEQREETRRDTLARIVENIDELSQRACKAKSERVAQIYETQIEKLAKEELLLREMIDKVKEPSDVDFETALNAVLNFLKNPYITWVNGDIDNKRLVLRLVFEEQVEYDQKNGFGTAVLSLPLRVFDYSAVSNSQAVEMAMKSWNQLENFIFEAYQMLLERDTGYYRNAA